jgi:Trypsin-like peptidase domain
MPEYSTRRTLRYSTVRIVARSKAHPRISVGTGFVFRVAMNTIAPGAELPLLVTCRHVVEGFDNFQFSFAAGDPRAVMESPDPGQTSPYSREPLPGKKTDLEISDPGNFWHYHSDPQVDVAVMPLWPIMIALSSQRSDPIYMHPIADIHIPDFADPTFDSVEEVLFVGYPTGIIDDKNFTPLVRRGITATPLDLDYGGHPAFLIDASVYPGSSGSPVFLFDSSPVFTPQGIFTRQRHYLIGMVSSTFRWEDEAKIIPAPIDPTGTGPASSGQMIDIGVVIKSHCINEAALGCLTKYGFPVQAPAPRVNSGAVTPAPMHPWQLPVGLTSGPRFLEPIEAIPADDTDRDEIWDEVLKNLGVGPDGGPLLP